MHRRIEKLIGPWICSVALLVAPAAHASHSETRRYTIGTTPGLGPTCQPDCLGLSGVNIGGRTFPGLAGEIPITVDVADSSGGNVEFAAGQDLDNDNLVGEEGEPYKTACGTSMTLATGSQVPFQAARQTTVFVSLIHPYCLGGLGLGGTITMTWGAPT